jgi:hypothetical protein
MCEASFRALVSSEIDGVSDQLHVPVTTTPRKEPAVRTEYEACWAPQPVWKLWRRYNYEVFALLGCMLVVVYRNFERDYGFHP